MNFSCFSVSSCDQLNLVYILLNSLKNTKQSETNITYYLLLDLDQQKNLEYCQTYFKPLVSPTFCIRILDIKTLLALVDKKLQSPILMIRCFISKFVTEDKILYLDTDMAFINSGIEELWNTDIKDYYCAAVEEPLVTHFMTNELENTKTKKYFNSGMMLFNLKKIREDKIDDEMISMIINWDENKLSYSVYDQSLMNYLFKEKVKFLHFRYNNSLLVITPPVMGSIQEFLQQEYNTTIHDSLLDAVILHFLGQNKPWNPIVREQFDVETDFPFKNACLKIWDFLELTYKRPND